MGPPVLSSPFWNYSRCVEERGGRHIVEWARKRVDRLSVMWSQLDIYTHTTSTCLLSFIEFQWTKIPIILLPQKSAWNLTWQAAVADLSQPDSSTHTDDYNPILLFGRSWNVRTCPLPRLTKKGRHRHWFDTKCNGVGDTLLTLPAHTCVFEVFSMTALHRVLDKMRSGTR